MALKDALLSRGLRLVSHPKVMKVVADPRVMTFASQVVQTGGRLQQEVSVRVARLLDLPNHDDVTRLRESIAGLESRVGELRERLSPGK